MVIKGEYNCIFYFYQKPIFRYKEKARKILTAQKEIRKALT
jgi:hypothetical protein